MFNDRQQAAEQLLDNLGDLRTLDVVIALPRGGVELGVELAKALEAPLDVVFVKKITAPRSPEYAVAATTTLGQPVFADTAKAVANITWFDAQLQATLELLKERENMYRQHIDKVQVKNKHVLVVDDGAATGITMKAALIDIAQKQPKSITVALPVLSLGAEQEIKPYADRIVSVLPPHLFAGSVGGHYRRFEQIEDEDVLELLKQAADNYHPKQHITVSESII